MWEKIQATPLASLCPYSAEEWSCCGDVANYSPDKSLHLSTLLSYFHAASRKKRHFLSWSLSFASKIQEEDLVKEEETSPKTAATEDGEGGLRSCMAEFYSHTQWLPPQKEQSSHWEIQSPFKSTRKKQTMSQPHCSCSSSPLSFLPIFWHRAEGAQAQDHLCFSAHLHLSLWREG